MLVTAASYALAASPAADAISAYRKAHGLPPVIIDAKLTQLAQHQADAMAHADVMDHSVAAPFTSRIASYNADIAVENIAAGTHDFASTLTLWEHSPGHNANLLRSGVTRMGIASAGAPQGRYKIYWALIMARPETKPPAAKPVVAGKPSAKTRRTAASSGAAGASSPSVFSRFIGLFGTSH